MAQQTLDFHKGDWIVHRQYSLGQIKRIEIKDIGGEATEYYRVESEDSIFWIPVDQMDSDFIRPIATPQEFQKVLEELKKPSEKMASNYKKRNSRIKKVRLNNKPRSIARLIRDLRAKRRKKKGLNQTERNALKSLTDRLIKEWALVQNIRPEKAQERLEKLLS